ncbi:MAG: hypothetical protein A2Y54_06285 [Chloroflexi bacterium RBG_16_51_16]|nr:MAG: hypothetical protein A2Y54_06285 [Chloroflexi bacterium RBG_16_51_16]
MYRHEKTFYNKTGIFLRVKANDPDLKKKVSEANAYKVNYVGMEFSLDGFAVEADGDLASAVKQIRSISKLPLIIIGTDPVVLEAALSTITDEQTLIYAADASNSEALAGIAKKYKASLVCKAETLEALADLTQKLQAVGVDDLVLDLGGKNMAEWLTLATQTRRLAIKNNYRPLGFPTIFFAGQVGPEKEAVYAAQAISKYTGFLVLDTFAPEMIYALLVLRENIYTDPQKPIQVQPGIYEINSPKPESPVLITTNFSITYFSVANEVESSGLPAWLVVTDAEGMSVLTAWAAGKFDAERIAKAIKGFDVANKVSRKRIVLPGHVAVLSGELEEELSGWEIRVGPREAVDLPAFMKQALN